MAKFVNVKKLDGNDNNDDIIASFDNLIVPEHHASNKSNSSKRLKNFPGLKSHNMLAMYRKGSTKVTQKNRKAPDSLTLSRNNIKKHGKTESFIDSVDRTMP